MSQEGSAGSGADAAAEGEGAAARRVGVIGSDTPAAAGNPPAMSKPLCTVLPPVAAPFGEEGARSGGGGGGGGATRERRCTSHNLRRAACAYVAAAPR
jgi:hypothetical protein